MEWRHYDFLIGDTKQIKVRNCENDAKDELDLKDRVIKMSAGFGYLVAITPGQCYIYRFVLEFEFDCLQTLKSNIQLASLRLFSVRTFNTPSITELKECCVTLIVQAEK